MPVRDAAGYLRECAHADDEITLCSLCLMREADLVDRRMIKTLAERVDLRATILKARKALGKTQAGLAYAMGISPGDLCNAKRAKKPLPHPALKWLISRGFLVEKKRSDAARSARRTTNRAGGPFSPTLSHRNHVASRDGFSMSSADSTTALATSHA